MWRNFRCLHITDVEKYEILQLWHMCDVENVAIYAKFMQFKKKCHNLRAFMWRKIELKSTFVEKNDKY